MAQAQLARCPSGRLTPRQPRVLLPPPVFEGYVVDEPLPHLAAPPVPPGRAPSPLGAYRHAPVQGGQPRQRAPSPAHRALSPAPRAPSPAPRAPSPAPRAPSPAPRTSINNPRGSYVKGDLVDYYSTSYQSWIAAQVADVNPETGAVQLDVKPQPIRLQEQHVLLRPRLRPSQAQLEWMHAVMREGRIHDEARALFARHAVVHRGNVAILSQEVLPAVAGDVDALLGLCGSVKGLILEARKDERELLTLDSFTSAFWDQVSAAVHTYGSALPKQHDGFRRLEDPRNAYDFEGAKTLGSGTYGMVKLVRERKTRAARAIKIISKLSMGGCLEMLQMEIENLCRVDHPHIAKLYEYFEYSDNLYLVMDFCSGGELQQAVSQAKRVGQRLPEHFAADVIRQVVLAIAHIHAHGIVHLDIKGANILLMPSKGTMPPVRKASIDTLAFNYERPHVMVIDLGVSQFFRPGNFRYNNPMGTPATMAPEVWSGEITPKADIFSCGVVLFELLSLKLPFLSVPVVRQAAVHFWTSQPRVDWGELREASMAAAELCRAMLSLDRRHRPTAPEALTWCFLHQPEQPGQGQADTSVPLELVQRVARLPERSVLYMSIALAIARRWPANQWPTVKRWFNELNVDGSGRLQKEHISDALQHLGVDKAQAGKVAEAMDLSRDGTVGWTEFMAACINLGSDDFEATLQEAFHEADSDDDGLLTQHDLSKLLPSDYAAERIKDIFHDLTGRTELGARLDWPTFRQHFRPRSAAGGMGAINSARNAGIQSFPDFFDRARYAADRFRSQLFPVPGNPEQEEEQLRRLAEMGFTDRARCLDVLRRHRNELSNSAVEELCRGRP